MIMNQNGYEQRHSPSFVDSGATEIRVSLKRQDIFIDISWKLMLTSSMVIFREYLSVL